MKKTAIILVASTFSLALLGLTGCSDEAKEKWKEAGSAAVDATKETAEDVKEGSKELYEKAKEETKELTAKAKEAMAGDDKPAADTEKTEPATTTN